MSVPAAHPAPASIAQPRGFCRGCGYALIGLESRNCPECGRAFDPADPRTFAARRPRGSVWRWGWRIAAVLLLCVLLGGAGLEWLRRGWSAEQKTIGQLRGLNTRITLKPIGPDVLGSVLGSRLGYLRDRVDGVIVSGEPTEKLELIEFKSLPHLEKLDLSHCQINDAVVTHISDVLTLRELILRFANIEDLNLTPLARLSRLEKLDFFGSQMEKAMVQRVGALTQLKCLNLGCNQTTDATLRQLTGFNNLTELDITYTAVTDAGLEHLKRLRSLHILHLHDTAATRAAIAKLKQAIPGLDLRQ